MGPRVYCALNDVDVRVDVRAQTSRSTRVFCRCNIFDWLALSYAGPQAIVDVKKQHSAGIGE